MPPGPGEVPAISGTAWPLTASWAPPAKDRHLSTTGTALRAAPPASTPPAQETGTNAGKQTRPCPRGKPRAARRPDQDLGARGQHQRSSSLTGYLRLFCGI